MFNQKRPIAYYAHSLRIYGTGLERQQQRRIRRQGYKVLNPNGQLSQRGWQNKAAMFIRSADVVICTEYCDHIGRGVAWEVGFALRLGKPVYVLRSRQMIQLAPSDIVDVGYNWAIQWAKIAA